MKKIIIISAIGLSTLSFSFTTEPVKPINAGGNSVSMAGEFAFFRGHRIGKNIELTWGMNSYDHLQDFVIMKTMQDPNDPYSVWEQIAVVGPVSDHNFKYCDTNVLPGTSCYKVIARYTDEGSAISELVFVTIKAGGH